MNWILFLLKCVSTVGVVYCIANDFFIPFLDRLYGVAKK